MAAFTCTGVELLEVLSEYAGHKAGLALSREELLDHIPRHASLIPTPETAAIRLRHEVMEEAVRELLHNLGAIQNPHSGITPTLALLAKYGQDPARLPILRCIENAFMSCVQAGALQRFAALAATRGANSTTVQTNAGPIDITPVCSEAVRQFGEAGLEMFNEFHELVQDHLQGNTIGSFRRTEWTDREELRKLFHSEGVSPSHGTFIDQRYIDYLAQNFEDVDRINWRKFEALTAEYFERSGFSVELGPGRNDDGVDIRVWKDQPTADMPPTLIVQCKRQKDKIDKGIVKALWTDVEYAGADAGLVVTTSTFEPGALATSRRPKNKHVARAYRIGRAERPKVKKWIHALRSPGSGIFLATE